MRYVFDIETDGINATLIHCLSYSYENGENKNTLYQEGEIASFLASLDVSDTLVGHNIIRYDIPVLEKLLKTKIVCRRIDTLAISWYLEPERKTHGLEGYGEEFGIKKPEIADWTNLTKEEYGWRCSEDVRINTTLWQRQAKHLWKLYEQDKDKLDNFLDYLTFKMSCIQEQESLGLRLDKELCTSTLEVWEKEKEQKIVELTAAMPKVPIKTTRIAPKVFYKENGELSKRAEEWLKLLEEKGLAKHIQEVEVIKSYEDGNPNSHDQLKKWLYSLGWVPEHIKYVRDKKTNSVKKIPQIASKEGGGEICNSIKKLIPKEPALAVLDGLSVLSHRISILKAFLEDEVDGRIYASASGLTNTLRLQHATIVNLPSVEKKYGKEVRGCLIADEGCVLCGSDLSNIEDRTKRHYIFKFDPKYVEEQSAPDYDAHLDIAMLAGYLTQQEVDDHKSGVKKQNAVRQKAKITNFSATYKIGADALSRNSGLPLSEAKKLLKIYWKRNWAILEVEKERTVKEVYGQKWLLNPVSGFWYSLRAEKDRFSTLNQGTAVYVFDVWLMYMRQLGLKIALQYHDEVLFNVRKDRQDYVQNIINQAITLTNNRLKLNVEVGCSVQYGNSYAECH